MVNWLLLLSLLVLPLSWTGDRLLVKGVQSIDRASNTFAIDDSCKDASDLNYDTPDADILLTANLVFPDYQFVGIGSQICGHAAASQLSPCQTRAPPAMTQSTYSAWS